MKTLPSYFPQLPKKLSLKYSVQHITKQANKLDLSRTMDHMEINKTFLGEKNKTKINTKHKKQTNKQKAFHSAYPSNPGIILW